MTAALVQTVAIENVPGNPTPMPIGITTSNGNTLVAFLGEDVSFSFTGAPVPAFYVADSAGNRWEPANMTASTNPGSRCAIWIAKNARPVTWVSVTPLGYVSTFIGAIAEFSGMPAFPVFDLIPAAAATSGSASSVTVSATALQADYVFGLMHTGSTDGGSLVVTSPAGLTHIQTYTYSPVLTPNGSVIDLVWGTAAAGAVSATWSLNVAAPISACLVGISQASFPPAQPVTQFPVVNVDMAFGAAPGTVTQSIMPWQWIDITPRTLGQQGSPVINATRGKAYELSSPEAGTVDIGLNNWDGAFNPLNTASPFWSNALNSNPTFANGVTTPWTAVNGATVAPSQAVTTVTPWSALVTPNGSTATPGIQSEQEAVNVNQFYSASAWVNVPAGYATGGQVAITWYTASHTLISTSTSVAAALTAGTWQQLVLLNQTPPANSTFATVTVQLSGTPSGATTFYVSQGALNIGASALSTGLVALGTPLRISAVWQSMRYPMYTGYVAKWPQDWPDLPQFGLSQMQAVDLVSVASTINLPSAVQGEILVDAPYACFPFDEQYTSVTQAPVVGSKAQVGTVLTSSECDGLIAVNTSRINQKTATYQDGQTDTPAAAPILTGQTLGLLGDNGSGMGATAYPTPAGTLGSKFRGPGAVYADAITTSGNGFALEFWVSYGAIQTSAPNQIVVATVQGAPWISSPVIAAPSGGGFNNILQVSIQNNAGVYGVFAFAGVVNGTGLNRFEPIATPPANGTALVHIVINYTTTGVTLYANGSNVNGTGNFGNPPAALPGPGYGWCFGSAQWAYRFTPQNGNFNLAYGTIYPYQLPPARIANHYTSGVTGFTGDFVLTRFGRLCAWSGVGLNPAAWPMPSDQFQVSFGAEYATEGTALSDALNKLTISEGGTWFASCAGALLYAPRQATFNNTSSITFGDSNTPGAENAYLADFGLDYDNAYLNNVTQATQVNGPNTLIAPIEKNLPSIAQYFQRGTLAQEVNSNQAQDAFDRAYWSLNKYDQPAMRLRTITVDCAAQNAAFPACLATDINDIATVNRRPLGATANYSLITQIQKVNFTIGPSLFKFQYVATPYTPDSTVLTADNAGFDVLGNNVLAW